MDECGYPYFEENDNGRKRIQTSREYDDYDLKSSLTKVFSVSQKGEPTKVFLNGIVVDEKILNHFEGYKETVRLYKTKEKYPILQDRFGNMNQPYCWSEIKCPSTGSTYLIENSADFKDAEKALAWLRPSFVPEELTYKWTQFAN